MQESKGMTTSMPTSGHLDLTKYDEPVDQKVYRSMIGSLLYLCASRPDIMLSVCMCARYQAAPKECHLKAVKRIVRYLIHTPNFGIWYPKRSSFDLVGYSDSDYAGDKVDRKSTSGTFQFLGIFVLQETKLSILIHRRSGVHCRWIMLCSITLDDPNSQGLRDTCETCSIAL